MQKKRWAQISFNLPADFQELLIGQLSRLGFIGFQQDDRSLHCYLEARKWTKKFESKLQKVLTAFREEFPSADVLYAATTLYDQNWNAVWERSISIVDVTDRIIIKPSWKKLRKKDKGKIVLHIDPKMSFGTGHHETTRLCLILLEDTVDPNARLLDFGTGSGILAIAATKLGAGKVYAIDNDPWSINNAKENIRRNRVNHKITTLLGGVEKIPEKEFDLIVCNIDFLFLKKFLPKLLKRLRNGGEMVISGLRNADLPAFLDILEGKGAFPIEIISENEWAALLLSKVNARRSS